MDDLVMLVMAAVWGFCALFFVLAAVVLLGCIALEAWTPYACPA